MIRLALLAGAAAIATPLAAQDHSAHAGHQAQPAEPEMDHCAMGHLPPEQCPPKHETPEDHSQHGAMDHSKMDHSGHTTDAAKDEHAGHSAMDHSGHGASSQQDEHARHAGMDHGQMNHGADDKSAPGAAPESAVPPRAFEGPLHAADAIWGEETMARARAANHATHGDMKTGVVMIERLEARIPTEGGEDGFLWDGQAWYGGDIDKIFFKTEGEGEFGGAVEDAEVQLLWSHAIGPFWDFQAGARLDIEPETRSHLALGVQGLAPYMFHVDAAAFLSDRGDVTARIEGEYDQKITQRLILQPRVELELAAQDIPEREIGAGLTKIEPGLRLRYEMAREFAPYIGIEYEAKLGETADIARANGEDAAGFKLLAGIRAWF
ncbi:copper resistance protein B [Erythrobacter sp. HKB08]|uniref:copper resistance protein B n=1 Tax=Erythrobacter sp. HKB08 TaxID=2502843 RepID=UPI001008A207|nr:copper resistance protein B [Erythrobacter sp. HKB08]